MIIQIIKCLCIRFSNSYSSETFLNHKNPEKNYTAAINHDDLKSDGFMFADFSCEKGKVTLINLCSTDS